MTYVWILSIIHGWKTEMRWARSSYLGSESEQKLPDVEIVGNVDRSDR